MQISIKMLGELQVFHDDQLIPLPASKLTRALLIYLLLNKRALRRDFLCKVFWPDTKDARGALRWALSKLRALLNTDIERLVTDKDYVSINTTNLDIDVITLSARANEQHSDVSHLLQLAEQLAIPLLDGIDLHNYHDFQHWLVAQRQQLTELSSKVWDQVATVTHTVNITEKTGASSTASQQILPNEALNISYCSSGDGVKIAYVSEGTGAAIVRPPLFLSHLQYEQQTPHWGGVFDQLTAQHKLIRYDDRGTGMSEHNVPDISGNHLLQDLEAVVEANNLSKFALLGISSSVALSIDYAVRHPERVSHLILLNGYATGWRANTDIQVRNKIEAVIALAESGWEQENPAFRQFYAMTFSPDASQPELDLLNEYYLLTANAKNAAALIAAFAEPDVHDKLAQVKVPTLVIHSLENKAVPALTGREIAATIPGAEFIGLSSTSHLLLKSEPAAQQFVDIVLDFISR